MEGIDGYLSIHRGGISMNKKEFLEELEKRLQALPKEEIQERLQFYSEAIDDRVEEGETEEQAIEEIGTLDEITWEIVKKTPLVTLVKEKVKPKRHIRPWEIVLLCVGFPLWFPLLITAFVLILVAYILAWVLVIVTYSVEMAVGSAGLATIGAGVATFFNGSHWLGFGMAGAGLMCVGFALLWVFACVGATKASINLTRAIILSIKKRFVKRG